MTLVYVALGANLAQPIAQLDNACKALSKLAQGNSFRVSSYYQSVPMGDVEQPDYVNAVACFETPLAPIALLDALQQIENEQGRVREQHWGPRTLDLDLLLYGEQNINHPRLIVPHYGMKQRSFVLVPLYELSPDLKLPCQTSVKNLCLPEMHAELTSIG